MTLFELLRPQNGGPEYITLREAIERGVFTVTEVSEGGSVPELMVANKGDVAVLLLDGEEVRGAKQNRILNTTILVGPKSTIKVPVSCVEHGRWSYADAGVRRSRATCHAPGDADCSTSGRSMRAWRRGQAVPFGPERDLEQSRRAGAAT